MQNWSLNPLKLAKNVFVEKPLCLTEEELLDIINSKLETRNSQLVVGFNRRFAPLARKMKQLLGEGTRNIIATMNAGFIPANSWVHDLELGGGRIIGEACHYIDLCTFLTGSKVKAVCSNGMGSHPVESTDNLSIFLKYENGFNCCNQLFCQW